MRRYIAVVCLLLSSSISAQPITPESEKVIARVNNDVITQQHLSTFRQFLEQQLQGQKVSEKRLLNELVKVSLLFQAAEQQKLDQRQDVKQQLFHQRKSILSAAMLSELAERLQPTEIDIQKAYDDAPSEEYHVNYLLVGSKDEAVSLINQLDNGANFTDLVGQYSIDPSKQYAGNLGWVNLSQIDIHLVNALKELKPEGYTKKPISNHLGWQVLQLKEKRDYTKPAFFQLRDTLRQQLLSAKLFNYIDELKETAKIVYPE
jgi:peptidyl-prolyl cis-trans isomerase C